ncbi:hypothetical protein WMY93_031221 [Mugilogobius chulae]|uniref:Ig-like domain-containing protein n=1 Tax=Mugilogobius chulae TaxID=88201 RepID=A0AAW0MG52_9GOBI
MPGPSLFIYGHFSPSPSVVVDFYCDLHHQRVMGVCGPYPAQVEHYHLKPNTSASEELGFIEDPETIVQMIGADLQLPCLSFFHESVEELKWLKLRIEADGVKYDTIFHYKNNRSQSPTPPAPQYRGRVQLKDPQMRRGELSVTLRRIRAEDSGIYKCSVTHSNTYEYKVRQTVAVTDPVLKPISRRPGQECELRCNSPFRGKVELLKWTKDGRFIKDREVYYFNQNFKPQHVPGPVFGDRVELSDPELSRGELSIVLKNLTLKDSGFYTCWAHFNTSHQYVHYQRLSVTDSPAVERQHRGLVLGLELGLVIGVGVCVFIAPFYRKPSHNTSNL